METCRKEMPPALEKKEKRVIPVMEEERIRVLIKASARETIIAASSSVDLKNLSGEKTLKKIEGAILTIGVAGDCMTLNGETLASGGVVVIPFLNGKLKVDGKSYRGEIKLTLKKMEYQFLIKFQWFLL